MYHNKALCQMAQRLMSGVREGVVRMVQPVGAGG